MLHIRKFRSKDWKNFKPIVREAFSRENIQKKNFKKLLDDEGFIGAFKNKKLVGYLRLLVMDDYGHLGQIAVERKERGKGYGNKLMLHAINYFEEKGIKKIGLYVETKNVSAISLYEKHGFKKVHQTWHYWIERDKLDKIERKETKFEEKHLRILSSSDYNEIMRTFPNANNEELRTHLGDTQKIGLTGGISLPLGLFISNNLQVYGRFNPEFPGCRPFWITDITYFDEFVKLMKEYKSKDHLRITFDRDTNLAKLFEERKYKLWHQLYFMEKELD